MTKSSKQGRPTDIIIIIVGQTGTGKTTFVNTLSDAKLSVGDDVNLTMVTTTVQPVAIQVTKGPFKGRQLVLVDAPGFNGTLPGPKGGEFSDSDIYQQITDWLTTSYDSKMKIAGIIYMHSITDTRVPKSGHEALGTLREFCEGDNIVLLATTMWNSLSQTSQIGQIRDDEIGKKYWKNDRCRFDGTVESAWKIINHILLKNIDATHSQLTQYFDDFQGSRKVNVEAGKVILKRQKERVQRIKTDWEAASQLQQDFIEEQSRLCSILRELVLNKFQISRRILIIFDVEYNFDTGTQKISWRAFFAKLFT